MEELRGPEYPRQFRPFAVKVDRINPHQVVADDILVRTSDGDLHCRIELSIRRDHGRGDEIRTQKEQGRTVSIPHRGVVQCNAPQPIALDVPFQTLKHLGMRFKRMHLTLVPDQFGEDQRVFPNVGAAIDGHHTRSQELQEQIGAIAVGELPVEHDPQRGARFGKLSGRAAVKRIEKSLFPMPVPMNLPPDLHPDATGCTNGMTH